MRAARLFVELEILEPESDAPNPNDYRARSGHPVSSSQESDWQKDMDTWRKRRRRRREQIAELMSQQLKEQKWTVFTRVNERLRRRYEDDLRAHRPQLYGLLRFMLGWREESPPRYVEIKGFHDLENRRDLIRRYFTVLQSLGETDNAFVAKTRITWGYLAPLFLITGLISRFGQQDGWTRIIDNYPALLAADKACSNELRALRSFLFNCWLLWGPSIPRCNCGMWHTGNGSLALQYGYGDENNALDVVIADGEKLGVEPVLREVLQIDGHTRAAPTAVGAIPFIVTGRLRWGPDLEKTEIGVAQSLIRGGSEGAPSPLEGRIVLEMNWAGKDIPKDRSLSPYYSAYLWIMFVIVDRQTGNPFYGGHAGDDGPREKWKNLLAYFEHGNIAEASTYQALKENLVAKVCASLAGILERESDRDRIAIGYVCAFDDSNCGGGARAVLAPTHGRLVDILQERIAREASALAAAKLDGRLFLPALHARARENAYGACHLPEIIESFYSELDEAALQQQGRA